jgi:hypothetical protein
VRPDELAATIAADTTRWGPIVKASGITLERQDRRRARERTAGIDDSRFQGLWRTWASRHRQSATRVRLRTRVHDELEIAEADDPASAGTAMLAWSLRS